MVRTQIQLTEEQAARLRAMSAERQVSMAELIRLSIDSFIGRQSGLTRESIVTRAKAAVGRYSSGAKDGSTEHDRYLTDAFDHR